MSDHLPKNLLYTREHEWICIDGEFATIGMTYYAQLSLGDIVFIELPQVGHELAQKDSFGVVESIKSVSDLYTPLAGEVVEVNDKLESEPQACNESPYTAWMIKLKFKEPRDDSLLLGPDEYADFCDQLS